MAHGRLVFLTGATGFIGERLARRLAVHGHRLRCLVRPSSSTADLERFGAELVPGDTTDVKALERGLAGVDLAYHLAAIYDVGPVDAVALERTNVGGTCAFLTALERVGTPRAVYVSTTVALGPVAGGVGDESTRHAGGYRSVYERTKTEAHRLAVAAQRGGAPLVVVCPAFVYGPGDRGPGGRFIADLLAGRVPGLVARPSSYSYVHVDDVVEGLRLAGEKARTGETYVLSGTVCTVNELAARVAALAGRRAPRLRFPATLARATGTVLDAISRRTRLHFPITRENVDMSVGLRWLHSHAKATRELGWRPRPLDEGLPQTVAWFAAQGAKRRGQER